MKAMVIHEYGGPEVMHFEDAPDPVPGPGDVLVRLAATSINPFDSLRRSGAAKEMAPIQFPGIVGVDVAGTVAQLGVGRSAVFTARDLGARVTAAVLRSQLQDAQALGAEQVIATDDADAIADLAPVDVVASTIGGRITETLIGKVKPGGVFATTLAASANAKEYPAVRVVPMQAMPDPQRLLYMSRAVRDGGFVIPIERKIPLAAAREGMEAAQKGVSGKILLTT